MDAVRDYEFRFTRVYPGIPGYTWVYPGIPGYTWVSPGLPGDVGPDRVKQQNIHRHIYYMVEYAIHDLIVCSEDKMRTYAILAQASWLLFRHLLLGWSLLW